MQIKKLSAIKRNLSLSFPFKFASYELTYLPYAWVRLETTDGTVGYGECPTYWDPSGETQHAAVGAIEHIEPSLTGIDVFDLEHIFSIIDSQIYGAFAAKCGIDMALYDIIGRKLNIPVYRLLGGGIQTVIVNGILPLGLDDDLMEKRVQEQLNAGHRIFKVKVGKNLKKEIEVVRKARSLLPEDAIIFLDANQGWQTPKTAIRAIRQFEPFEISWVEQPVWSQDIDGLKQVRDSVDVDIIADESLYSPVDAIRLIRSDAVDMFNIKLAKSGGMYIGKKIWNIAQAANIDCALGSMIESSLGMLANYHFARSIPMKTCGLSAFQLIKDDIDVGLKIENGELILKSDEPGLGYTDASLFEAYFQV